MPAAKRYNVTIGRLPVQFVWFRVAKVGTRSILAALKPRVTEFEVEQGYSTLYRPKRYSDHFKFAFVRSPYARIVSGWADKIVREAQGGGVKDPDLRERLKDFPYFIDWLTSQEASETNIHYRPQSLLVPDEVDFIGRMERFEPDLRLVFRHVGLGDLDTVPRHNKSGTPPQVLKDASPDTSRKITEFYRGDFERFGYAPRD
jgi:hypothetical protein